MVSKIYRLSIRRLISQPNLLISKVLKAKYYPKDSIFSCKLSKNSSWIWQSLMSVREEFGNGIWRKVGNGRSINIWEDAWIPDNPGGKITSSKTLGCELTKVEELISNFRWNYPLIFRTFNKKNADSILKIPMSLAGREDSNFWIHSPTGQYTAKTGYECLSMKDKKLSNKNSPEG